MSTRETNYYDSLGNGEGNPLSDKEKEEAEDARRKKRDEALLNNGTGIYDPTYYNHGGTKTTRKNYDKCTVAELKSKASDKKIKGYSKMTKQELINVLRGKR